MTAARKILIADPDLDGVRLLSKALRRRDYQVYYAADGSRALELTILRHPDLVLFDAACGLIEARTFAQILRTNPRTEDIPVVVTATSPEAGELVKPLDVDEVLARIDHQLQSRDAARALNGDTRELDGALSQLSIPDLLQMLSMNRRSGRLSISRGEETGEIEVADGRPVNATTGLAQGEKALFRMLAWTEGTFSFVPGEPSAVARIGRAMGDALLEGLRQVDELRRLGPDLPPRNAQLQRVDGGDPSSGADPVAAQIPRLLETPRSLAELVDLHPATDLEVLAALAGLLRRGAVRVDASETGGAGEGPLLAAPEAVALRARLLRGRPVPPLTAAKVFLCTQAPARARSVLAPLPGLTQVAPEASLLETGFGTLARLEVSEGVRIDFFLLPGGEASRPLWRPFSNGALGALVLDGHPDSVALAAFFGWTVRVPLVVLGDDVPQALTGAPAGVAAVGESIDAAVRAVLVQALASGPRV